eukprot:scaffold22043_cov84-Isochrysis_galbana.AAC.4
MPVPAPFVPAAATFELSTLAASASAASSAVNETPPACPPTPPPPAAMPFASISCSKTADSSRAP